MKFVGIDLSTKTGLVILDEFGQVAHEEEITSNKTDPSRMIEIIDQVMQHINKKDIIAIEGFSYGSRGRGIDFQFGLGHAMRIKLFEQGYDYLIVTPSQVKKYATGKGNTSKDNMILPIYKRWNYEHESDNVRDAFVLSQIAYATKKDITLTRFQQEIINDLTE